MKSALHGGLSFSSTSCAMSTPSLTTCLVNSPTLYTRMETTIAMIPMTRYKLFGMRKHYPHSVSQNNTASSSSALGNCRGCSPIWNTGLGPHPTNYTPPHLTLLQFLIMPNTVARYRSSLFTHQMAGRLLSTSSAPLGQYHEPERIMAPHPPRMLVMRWTRSWIQLLHVERISRRYGTMRSYRRC